MLNIAAVWHNLIVGCSRFFAQLRNDASALATLRCLGLTVAFLTFLNLVDNLCLYYAVLNKTIGNPFLQSQWFYLLLAAPIAFLGRAARFYAILILLLTSLIVGCDIFLALAFSTRIGSDIVEVIYASSHTELGEFTVHFSRWEIWSGSLLFLLVLALVLWFACRRRTAFKPVFALLALALALPCSIDSLRLAVKEPKPWDEILRRNVVTELFFCFYHYREQNLELKNALQNPRLPSRLQRIDNGDILGIVIIGESVSRSHMSLFGYPRPTSPRLTAMRNELIVFDNVISSFAQTAVSLMRVFTIISDRSDGINCSLVNLCSNTGFYTEFISNQYRWGTSDNSTSLIFRSVDRREFLTETNTRGSTDANIIPALQQRLPAVANRPAVFFLHLIGNHFSYNRRYPESFNRFKQHRDDITQNLSHERARILNEYDNAILYNDTVIADLIEKVRATGRPAFVLYFSDHGEPVFEDGVTNIRHSESTSRYVYEVPMILWLSPQYKARFPRLAAEAAANAAKPYQTNDLTYGLAALLRLSYDAFPDHKNIFSASYRPRPRYIAGQDYDRLYPAKDDFKKLFGKKAD